MTLAGAFVVVPAAYVVLLRDRGDDPGSDPGGDPSGDPGGTELLLQLRRGTGFMDEHWGAGAAGHVERGETAIQAARREAREEIGVTDLDLTFLTTMQRTRGGDPIDERVDFFFTARSWRGEPRILEPDRCGGLGWFPLDDLPDPVVPHEREVLVRLASGAVPPYSTFGFTDHPGRNHPG